MRYPLRESADQMRAQGGRPRQPVGSERPLQLPAEPPAHPVGITGGRCPRDCGQCRAGPSLEVIEHGLSLSGHVPRPQGIHLAPQVLRWQRSGKNNHEENEHVYALMQGPWKCGFDMANAVSIVLLFVIIFIVLILLLILLLLLVLVLVLVLILSVSYREPPPVRLTSSHPGSETTVR